MAQKARHSERLLCCLALALGASYVGCDRVDELTSSETGFRSEKRDEHSSNGAAGTRRQEDKSLGTLHADAPKIVISEAVLEDILDHAATDPDNEVGGFLLGIVRNNDEVEIRHFITAKHTISKAKSLTFTQKTWETLNAEMDEKHSNLSLVGWQHTHPGAGVFLSGYDMFIHKTFFDRGYQVAMVVDPKRGELGFFQWRNGKVVDCGFAVRELTGRLELRQESN